MDLYMFLLRMTNNISLLSSRSLLRISGSDALHFLQGLITKDINCIDISGAIYAFFLNAKGRILSDLLIYKINAIDGVVLETDTKRITALERTLMIYRMKRSIEIEQLKQYSVLFSCSQPSIGENVFGDPRLSNFGYRIIEKNSNLITSSETEYVKRRMKWGIAEGFEELGEQIPLQMNGDLLNGISFEKGCYIGQELIARTHHTGVIRRRVFPIQSLKGEKIIGKFIIDSNGKKLGKILRVHDYCGIALVSLNFMEKLLLTETNQLVKVTKPEWWPKNV